MTVILFSPSRKGKSGVLLSVGRGELSELDRMDEPFSSDLPERRRTRMEEREEERAKD